MTLKMILMGYLGHIMRLNSVIMQDITITWYLYDHLHVMVAHLHQVLGDHGPAQLAVKQLSIKEKPGAAHEEGNGGPAGVVGKQSHLHALHEEGGELNPAGRHQVKLHASQVIRIH